MSSFVGKHVNVSRRIISSIEENDVESLGASYTHVKTLKGVIGPSTKKIIMYHSFVENLDGFEDTKGVDIVYLGFNRIKELYCRSKSKSKIICY